jgi:3-hydroxybutyrate dehydrogenase
MRLEDKAAVVTGAESGIGSEIAPDVRGRRRRWRSPTLKQAGADTAAGEIAAAGGTAMGIAMDVTDEAEVDAGFAKLAATYGGADVLRSATPASRSSSASISSSSPSGSGSWRSIWTARS